MKIFNIYKKLIFLLLLLSALPASAEWQSLIVELRDQDPVILDLSDMLTISMDDEAFTISDEGYIMEFRRDEIVSFKHSARPFNVMTGIEHPDTDSDIHNIRLCGNKVVFSGFPLSAVFRIYSIDGTFSHSREILAGYYEYDLSELPSGVYILNVDGVSCKIKKN